MRLLLLFCFLTIIKLSAQERDPALYKCVSSIATHGAPLLVVDGQAYPLNSLGELDRDHIVDMSITGPDDPVATAVYGPSAANGLVVVTTDGKGLPPADYVLNPGAIPTDLFDRYEDLHFSGDLPTVYFLDDQPTTLAHLKTISAIDIRDVRIFRDAQKLQRIAGAGVERAVYVRLLD